MVGNTFAAVFMIENTVLVKEIEKYSSCNTLVSVTEAMILAQFENLGELVKNTIFVA